MHQLNHPWNFRSIEGTEKNQSHSEWGRADVELLRFLKAAYTDGSGQPVGLGRPSARAIGNAIAAQEESRINSIRASDFVWQWGQFLDHDIDLTLVMGPSEPFDISVPAGDPYFDPLATGMEIIPLDRSFYRMVEGVRQQVNEITAFIDASNVYGSDSERALELRMMDGTGRMKTSPGGLLPSNENGFPNAPDSQDPSFFWLGT